MKLTIENINIKNHKIYDSDGKYRGEIIYEYIRGSQLYHTNIEGIDSNGNPISDEDHGGVYIMPNNSCLGLGIDYQNEIKDESGDICIWEIGRFLELALTSNPTVLEALFVPEDKVIYEHPLMKEIRKYNNSFLTKKCFAPFGGYASSQIKKAQGQNKKIHWDIIDMSRKMPMDFCYTFHKQGSIPMQKWLDDRGLDQRNCGLVNVPNMPDMYGVYYDFGQHMKLAGVNEWKDLYRHIELGDWEDFFNYIKEISNDDLESWYYNNRTPKGGHCGIVSPNSESNEVRMSSIPDKNAKPICMMSFNANGYGSHCKKYKEYEEWKTKRNKARYESNMEGEKSGNPDMKYDSKNIMHCFRLMAMAKEIAEGKGMLLDRTNIDRDFLLDVRNRKYGYSILNEKMIILKNEMDKAIENSTITEEINTRFVNDILLDIRNNFKHE